MIENAVKGGQNVRRAVIAGVLWGVVGLAATAGGVWLLVRLAAPAAVVAPPQAEAAALAETGPVTAGHAGAGLVRAEHAGAGPVSAERVETGPVMAGHAETAPVTVGQEEAEAAEAGSDTAGQPDAGSAEARSSLPPATHPVADYQPMHVEAVEPILPDPPPAVPDEWQRLHETVWAVASEYPGRLSVVAVDLTTGSRYEFRAGDPYLPASTFKLPVTLCVLQAIDAGELTWDTLITYTEADWEPVGAGYFAEAAFGSQWSVRNLVDRSLISSNNVAVKMLARTLTWDGLLQCTTEMGGPVTRTEEGSTPVTAADEAAWWLRLWELSQERPELAEQLLGPLRRVTYHGRIQAGTPRPELVTHKFGTYAGYDHDGAIVWAERPYALVVLTYGGGEYAADVAIARIASAAWESLMGP